MGRTFGGRKCHSALLVGSYAEPPHLLDSHLPGHVGAAVIDVGRQPFVCRVRAFGLIGRAVHCQQIERVGGKLLPARRVPPIGPRSPSVGEGNHVIYLHGLGTMLPPREVDYFARIRILQLPRQYHAIASIWPVNNILHVAAQNVVAGVAAVMILVGPTLAEFVPIVFFGLPPLAHGQGLYRLGKFGVRYLL